MTEDPLLKFASAVMAIFSSSVNRLLNILKCDCVSEVADIIELIDELLFSFITNSCSLLSVDGAGETVPFRLLKVNTGWGMSRSALSCERLEKALNELTDDVP